jgi:hypothetical protein
MALVAYEHLLRGAKFNLMMRLKGLEGYISLLRKMGDFEKAERYLNAGLRLFKTWQRGLIEKGESDTGKSIKTKRKIERKTTDVVFCGGDRQMNDGEQTVIVAKNDLFVALDALLKHYDRGVTS